MLSCNHSSKPQFFRSVKGIAAVFTIVTSLAISACGLFGPAEASRRESGRTVFRAAEETPMEVPEVTPVQQKVPGENR
jgi:hypothetical protein